MEKRGDLQLGWDGGAEWGPQGDVAHKLAPDGELSPPRAVQRYRQKGEWLRAWEGTGGRTEKGPRINQTQPPDAPTLVSYLRSREKERKKQH